MARAIVSWLAAALCGGCAAGASLPGGVVPTPERAAGAILDPREIGQPPERADGPSRRAVERALQQRGRLDAHPLPGEVRTALIELQRAYDLAATGRIDADTARLLGLDPAKVLPLVAGSGVLHGAGATADGGQVGGEPGPAAPVPDAAELGAIELAAPDDPVFQFEEARRLRDEARMLRGRAAIETDRRAWFERQAKKAEWLFRRHAERLDRLGGESALAGRSLAARTGEEGPTPPSSRGSSPPPEQGAAPTPADARSR